MTTVNIKDCSSWDQAWQQAHSHGVAIDVIEELWENINVDHKGWNPAFDLVFASMSSDFIDWCDSN